MITQEKLNIIYWNGYANEEKDFIEFRDAAKYFANVMHDFQTTSVKETGDLAFNDEELDGVMSDIIDFYRANGNKINPGVIEAMIFQY